MSKFSTALFMAVALCVTFTANAARPSITSLQQQINQLQAENNAQQAQIDAITNSEEKIPEPGQAVIVDANGTMIGDVQAAVGGFDGAAKIYFEVNEKFYSAYLETYEEFNFYSPRFYYDLPGCVGNSYTDGSSETIPGYESTVGARSGMLYITDGDRQTVEVLSMWSERGFSCYEFGVQFCDSPEIFNCLNVLDYQPEPEVIELSPAAPIIDTNIYTKPYRLKLTPPN